MTPHECVIIIVAWNCWEHLFDCLDALSTQTNTDFSILIIDNGDAEDQQVECVKRYPNVLYIKSPTNLGFAAGNNLGIKLAQGASWIILLNPDTIPTYNWFEKFMDAAIRYPDFAFFASKLLREDKPTLLDGEGDSYHVSGMAWRNGMGLPEKIESNEPWEVFSPCAAAALYKAEALKCVKGFDEDFFCYMEDVDLGFRLRLAGYRCLTIPDAKVLHVGSATTVKRSPFYVYHGQRNLVWAYIKNMPGILFWLFLPIHLALNVVGFLRYAISGQFRVVWRAKYDAIKALPKIWSKRRIIQKARRVSLVKILEVLDKRLIPGLGRSVNSLWK